jgi:spore coat protein U-like protein
MRFKTTLVAALAVFALGAAAFATTATSNMSVQATVIANCTITASALDFGNYDPVSANASSALNGSTTVAVNCTNGAAATITMGQGSNAAGGSTDDAPLRRLKTGTNYLSYYLYQNAGRTTVWGNTAGTGAAHTGTGSSENVNVYAKVTEGQNVPAGTYTDTVVATITF